MFWIDLLAILIVSLWFVVRLGVADSTGERLALAVLLGLGIKSLFLFLFLAFGIQPLLGRQFVLSAGVLLAYVFWIRLRSGAFPEILTQIKRGKMSLGNPACWLLGVLFVLSLVNALFFPITGADGIWYHVKGMVYYHEADFESERIISQFRQYPPMIGLLYAWLISGACEQLTVIFPVLYVCLLAIVYQRILEHAGSSKLAALSTLVLGTTPYLWWHSFLPFLDWTAGVFYAVGMLYWFSLAKKLFDSTSDEGGHQVKSLALLSGLFFGLAGWTRPEFVLYSALPLFLLVCVLDRRETPMGERNPILARFSTAALIPPSLWFAVLLNFDGPLDSTVKQLIMACAGLWIAVGLVLSGAVRLTPRVAVGTALAAGSIALIGLFLFLPGNVSPWTVLAVRFFRLFAVHLFYAFTIVLVVFLFRGKIASLSSAEKLLGIFLLLFPFAQFVIYSYSGLKWPALSDFIDATFIHPGNSVNLSDTRGTIALYPAFVFFVICLLRIKGGLESVLVRRVFTGIVVLNLVVLLTVFAGPRIQFIAEHIDRPAERLTETTGASDLPNQFIKTYRVVNRIRKMTSPDAAVFFPSGDREGSIRSVATQGL
ncbi:MAG: hypothetical protein IID18_08160, partial [Nitrospinae bacterium]|nr:hypothetical protein [Nitrospinota bacterium]